MPAFDALVMIRLLLLTWQTAIRISSPWICMCSCSAIRLFFSSLSAVVRSGQALKDIPSNEQWLMRLTVPYDIPAQSYTCNWIARYTHTRMHSHTCASWKVFDNEIDIIRICVTNFALKGFSNRISNFTVRHHYTCNYTKVLPFSEATSSIFVCDWCVCVCVSLWWCVCACLRSCVIVLSTLRLQYLVRLIVCCSSRAHTGRICDDKI